MGWKSSFIAYVLCPVLAVIIQFFCLFVASYFEHKFTLSEQSLDILGSFHKSFDKTH